MTDVEDTLEFLLERGFVDELRLAPVERMARGSLQAPFANAGVRWAHVETRLRRAPSGNGWHASAPLSRASRTSRRFRRTLPRAPAWPCPDTCRCTRASRRR